MKRLSLHHLTALDATPAELATIAGRLECQHITLFTHVPEQARAMFPCVMPDDVPALSDALASANVSVCNLEVFPLDQDGGLGRFAEGLKTGAALGAPRATVHILATVHLVGDRRPEHAGAGGNGPQARA